MENEEKNDEIIGELFDTIQFRSQTEIDDLINNLNTEQIRYITTLALSASHRRGCLNLLETEFVSKIIRKL
jgi:hypothetical protein